MSNARPVSPRASAGRTDTLDLKHLPGTPDSLLAGGRPPATRTCRSPSRLCGQRWRTYRRQPGRSKTVGRIRTGSVDLSWQTSDRRNAQYPSSSSTATGAVIGRRILSRWATEDHLHCPTPEPSRRCRRLRMSPTQPFGKLHGRPHPRATS